MIQEMEFPVWSMFSALKKMVSLRYDDRPMSDGVYEFHGRWIKLLHDYYLKTEHAGHLKEGLQAAREDHAIFISNHALTLEAVLLGYFLMKEKAGKIGTLVYPEAFKLPLVREFFRSCQCIPISVDRGVETLQKRHVLVFPEGMDFINGLVDPNRVPRFHKGFLRIAKKYLEKTGRKSLKIIPIAHAGVENAVKLWVVRNDRFLDTLIRPFASFPFFVFPKLPILFPGKVVMNWGVPIQVTRDELKTDRKIAQKANQFRGALLALKSRAQKLKKMSVF